MIDFFTFFTYTFLFGVLLVLANFNSSKNHDNTLSFSRKNFRTEYFFSILLISLIVGFRYNVGNDWQGYVDIFNEIKRNTSISFENQYYEFSFFYLNRIFHLLNLPYQWLFFSIAFISWYFLYKSLPNKLIPLFIFFIFTNEYFFWSMNGIRQFIAIAIWVYSIPYIINKQKYYYFLFVFLAYLFHKSAILLVLFYFLPLKYNRKLFLILFIVSFYLGATENIISGFFEIFNLLNSVIPVIDNYSKYFDINKDIINFDLNYGLGYYFIVIVNFLVLFFSESVIKKYSSSKIYFILFAIGAVIFNLSTNVFVVGRFNTYLLFIKTIVLSYTFFYYWNFKKYRIFIIFFLLFFVFFFYVAIYNSSNMCSPYQFLI